MLLATGGRPVYNYPAYLCHQAAATRPENVTNSSPIHRRLVSPRSSSTPQSQAAFVVDCSKETSIQPLQNITQISTSNIEQTQTLSQRLEAFVKDPDSNICEVSSVSLDDYKMCRSTLLNLQIKFDYNAELEKLILHAPSKMHEQCIWYFNKLFCAVMANQQELSGGNTMGAADWGILMNILTPYEDANKGEFIADLTLCAANVTLLLVEIAFTQAWDKIQQKVDRMLASDKIVGIIVVHIREKNQFSAPNKSNLNVSRETVDDYLKWCENVGEVKAEDGDAFGKIHIYGWDWMGDVECVVEVIPKEGNRCSATLPGEGPIVLPELDSELADLWEDHVHMAAQLCGAVNFQGSIDAMDDFRFADFQCNWTELRALVAKAMITTSYDRFCRWGGIDPRKRKDGNYSKLITISTQERRAAKKRRMEQ